MLHEKERKLMNLTCQVCVTHFPLPSFPRNSAHSWLFLNEIWNILPLNMSIIRIFFNRRRGVLKKHHHKVYLIVFGGHILQSQPSGKLKILVQEFMIIQYSYIQFSPIFLVLSSAQLKAIETKGLIRHLKATSHNYSIIILLLKSFNYW